MKPNEQGIEEFFSRVETTFYQASDYTQVTDEYKRDYEAQHSQEEITDSEALNIITGGQKDEEN